MRYTADPLLKVGLRPDYTKDFDNLANAVSNASVQSNSYWEANNGGIRYLGHIAVGSLAAVDTTPGLAALSGTSSAALTNYETFTDGTLTNNATVLNAMSVNASANNASNWIAQNGLIEVTTGNTRNYTGLIAGDGGAVYHYGTGTITEADGIVAITQNNSSGNITLAQDVRSLHLNYGSGTVSNHYGLSSQVVQVSGTNVITTNHGVHAYNPLMFAGSIGTNVGVYIAEQTAASTNYNLYSAGSSAINYFEGVIRVGTGSAGTPTYSFTGDINTGLYSSSADILGISTGGVAQMLIDGGAANSSTIEFAPTDRTYTAQHSYFKNDNTYTINFASGIYPIAYDYTSTLIFQQDGYGLGSGFLFWNRPIIQNSSGSTRNIGPTGGYVSQPTIQANGGSLTQSFLINFFSNSTINRINSGTTTIGTAVGFWHQGATVGAGSTLTDDIGVYMSQIGSNAGTWTNATGLQIDSYTLGTNRYSAKIAAPSTSGATTVRTLWLSHNADNTVESAGIHFGSSADTNLYRSAASTLKTDDSLVVMGRLQANQGADVASANNLVLGSDGNTFEITGTTQINLISNLTWQNGCHITLLFTSTPTVKHNQATSTTNITIQLAGAADFVASAGDTLSLVLCEIGGTQAWRETARAVI